MKCGICYPHAFQIFFHFHSLLVTIFSMYSLYPTALSKKKKLQKCNGDNLKTKKPYLADAIIIFAYTK